MTLIAICEAPGTSASTTTALALAGSVPGSRQPLLLECDPSGGDIAAWAGLAGNPSWSSAVSVADRSWPGMHRHLQRLPSELRVMLSPPTASRAAMVLPEAADRFASMLSALDGVIALADCGRIAAPTRWHQSADIVVLLVRQARESAGATVARIERAVETAGTLRQLRTQAFLLAVGDRPYPPQEIEAATGLELLGALPEDPSGASLVAGAWTLGKGASRSPLARAARVVAATLADAACEAAVTPEPSSIATAGARR